MSDVTALDNPVWAALSDQHHRFAEFHGQAARYGHDFAPFAAVSDQRDTDAWEHLRKLNGNEAFALAGVAPTALPKGWELVRHLPCFQMVETEKLEAPPRRSAPRIESLGIADADEMLELVRRAEPGPFSTRAVELGQFVGVRAPRRDALVAMAGERFAPTGWREVSAVCTHADYRGRGYASRLIAAVIEGIHNRGERAFLHVTKSNPAVRVYESLGFAVRRDFDFVIVRATATHRN